MNERAPPAAGWPHGVQGVLLAHPAHHRHQQEHSGETVHDGEHKGLDVIWGGDGQEAQDEAQAKEAGEDQAVP